MSSPVHRAFGVARHLEDVALRRVVQHAADVGIGLDVLGPVEAGPAAHIRVVVAVALDEFGDFRLVF